MAHFYGMMRGSRGETTRCGTKTSGLRASVAGWNIGAHVEISHEDGRDIVRVYSTGGSNAHAARQLVACFEETK